MKHFIIPLFVTLFFSSVQAQLPEIPSLDFTKKTGNFTDERDGKTYAYKQFGDYDLFMHNLNWDGYNGTDESTRNSKGLYTADDPEGKKYGRLYSKTYDGTSLCPLGWKLPVTAEFRAVFDAIIKDEGITGVDISSYGGYSNFTQYLRVGGIYDATENPEGLWQAGGGLDPKSSDIQFNLIPAGVYDKEKQAYEPEMGIGYQVRFMLNEANYYFAGNNNSFTRQGETVDRKKLYHSVRCIRKHVDDSPAVPLDKEIAEAIIKRIREDKLKRNKSSLEQNVVAYLAAYQADGSFDDINYAAQSRSNWEPMEHLYRLREMSIAYTEPDNVYYEDEELYNKIVKGYQLWYDKNLVCTMNWYYNRISHPHALGEGLIALYPGKKKITEESVFKQLTDRWANDLGHPDIPADATTAGANKSNIAMHWIYRSVLTQNEKDLAFAADRSFLQLAFTTGEGVQHDFSYRQHGAQLYLAGYGREFIQLATRQAYYLAGTPYALSGEKRDILSKYVRNTYLNIIRGNRLNYNIFGRSLTRENGTSETGLLSILEYLKAVDPDYTQVYTDAIKRIKKEEPASHAVTPFQKHYYRGEYTLHVRPEYTFDVRMASSRMVRSEYDINENREGFFLTDGGTCIAVDGEEYGTIIPLWDWRRIPGTTVPELTTMVRANSYIFNGRSNYAGGVSDGMYGVTAFDMVNNQELFAYNDDIGVGGTPNPQNPRLPALDFGAKKSWFMFDKEIVCLGAGIYSGHEEPINTTVNQCRKDGDIVLSVNGSETVVAQGVYAYENPDWVLNDKTAYFFPVKSNIHVRNETKTGKWSDVNNSFASSNEFTKNMFTLWIDHGVKPENEKYAYIIVPNASVEKARNYTSEHIEILANNDSIQAVYHKELDIYSFAFFRSASFRKGALALETNAGCLIMVKNANTEEVDVVVADPQKSGTPIKIGIETEKYTERRSIVYEVDESVHIGKSIEYKVNGNTPLSTGRDVLLDRSMWTITTSYEGPQDGTVYGDNPNYIIDGDLVSSFLFVKPGKELGGIKIPTDAVPYFTIDMQMPQEMTYFLYRHRTQGNTQASLRVSKASFLGKNNPEDEFETILEDVAIPTDINEVRIDFPEKKSFRYVRFVYREWNTATSNTIQVSEFNLGNSVLLSIPESSSIDKALSPEINTYLYPNPVKRGEIVRITSSVPEKIVNISIHDFLGKRLFVTDKTEIPTSRLQPGIYFIVIKGDASSNFNKTCKLIVK